MTWTVGICAKPASSAGSNATDSSMASSHTICRIEGSIETARLTAGVVRIRGKTDSSPIKARSTILPLLNPTNEVGKCGANMGGSMSGATLSGTAL